MNAICMRFTAKMLANKAQDEAKCFISIKACQVLLYYTYSTYGHALADWFKGFTLKRFKTINHFTIASYMVSSTPLK